LTFSTVIYYQTLKNIGLPKAICTRLYNVKL